MVPLATGSNAHVAPTAAALCGAADPQTKTYRARAPGTSARHPRRVGGEGLPSAAVGDGLAPLSGEGADAIFV